jgi:pyridoxamine 5'-phosphate oxidase
MIDPYTMFSSWNADAQQGAVQDPDIVALATASREGRPSVRMVLYRGFKKADFRSSRTMRAGRDANGGESICGDGFYWSHLGKQIRIEGRVERLSAESDRYFNSAVRRG